MLKNLIMKTHRLQIVVFLMLYFSSYSQDKFTREVNFTIAEKKLTEYSIDSCLVGLLEEIVNLDTSERFPSTVFFYDLSFEDRGNYRNMMILPSRWEKAMVLDYKGIIKVGKMSFLCRGDIDKGCLFKAKENVIDVLLKKPKGYQYDSIDVVIESFSWKPTLAGKYTFCKGALIDIFILVGGNMKTFGIKKES